ncbi:MAG: hypothetical protein QOI78_7737 [Actinomycetota bacterium]|jgi:hypothetical protein|nr:hypothetical protein [Actinomycetota bacterium]
MTMPMSATPGWDTAGATLLVLWALAMWAAVGVLAYANRGPVRPWVYRGSVLLIGVGVIGQLGHVQEHVAQVGYWLGHPNSPAWMTPWGTSLANGLQLVLPSRPTFGMELLHLTGNFIFLAGLVGVMVITRRATRTRARRWGKMGVWMQGIHGLEHLALTLSVAFGSRAIGLSTFFGLIDPGPGLTTYRVWWHFIANVIGSIIFGLAVHHLWKERRAVRATYSPRPAPVLTEQAA